MEAAKTRCAVRKRTTIWNTRRVHTCLNLSLMCRTITLSERLTRRSAFFFRWTPIRCKSVRARWNFQSLSELRASLAVGQLPSRCRWCAVANSLSSNSSVQWLINCNSNISAHLYLLLFIVASQISINSTLGSSNALDSQPRRAVVC